ncbi:hypothetical protein OV207_35590 [Corallococcus sp. BB11-1]|uniref:hypothetical protein n=1 Tax=Corallococcus sp. BB11-1 TaxID=2996783 RepID=UPI0010DACAE6|nr:hypothetical protein [Corallococcus sp. BB11-1]MCY1036815.1 hypothetical protein [Corallococcus sp. BB11-1]RYZ18053.1 MAG: hypothetical protein EOO70_00015 [Myxococcaceae bacterium]
MTTPHGQDVVLPDDPPKRSRRLLDGPERDFFGVRLKTTAPILGGAPRTREVDAVDVIRERPCHA